jgi:hypothetical protein
LLLQPFDAARDDITAFGISVRGRVQDPDEVFTFANANFIRDNLAASASWYSYLHNVYERRLVEMPINGITNRYVRHSLQRFDDPFMLTS